MLNCCGNGKNMLWHEYTSETSFALSLEACIASYSCRQVQYISVWCRVAPFVKKEASICPFAYPKGRETANRASLRIEGHPFTLAEGYKHRFLSLPVWPHQE